MSLWLVDHFYPAMSYRPSIEEESDEFVVQGFGHSLRSAISCQRKWLKHNGTTVRSDD